MIGMVCVNGYVQQVQALSFLACKCFARLGMSEGLPVNQRDVLVSEWQSDCTDSCASVERTVV